MSGTTIEPGLLVGVPFPYSDLSTQKRRPVLVLTSPDRHGDFIGLAVTSVATQTRSVTIEEDSMQTGTLPRQSWIRCDKVFTIESRKVLRTYGRVQDHVMASVLRIICPYLGCSG